MFLVKIIPDKTLLLVNDKEKNVKLIYCFTLELVKESKQLPNRI